MKETVKQNQGDATTKPNDLALAPAGESENSTESASGGLPAAPCSAPLVECSDGVFRFMGWSCMPPYVKTSLEKPLNDPEYLDLTSVYRQSLRRTEKKSKPANE